MCFKFLSLASRSYGWFEEHHRNSLRAGNKPQQPACKPFEPPSKPTVSTWRFQSLAGRHGARGKIARTYKKVADVCAIYGVEKHLLGSPVSSIFPAHCLWPADRGVASKAPDVPRFQIAFPASQSVSRYLSACRPRGCDPSYLSVRRTNCRICEWHVAELPNTRSTTRHLPKCGCGWRIRLSLAWHG